MDRSEVRPADRRLSVDSTQVGSNLWSASPWGSESLNIITCGFRAGHRGELSNAFAEALISSSHEPDCEIGTWFGLEHEYRILRDNNQIDFRTLIHSLGLGQDHLDPGDPNVYRLSSGESLTCDEAEAEVALPPIRCYPGYTGRVEASAGTARARLRQVVPAGLDLEGYSTHLSVSVPDAMATRVADLYTKAFAPALMLLVDRRHSPGLLVRPRPDRVELCGEFAESFTLRAAAAFAVGSVRACAVAVAGGRTVRASIPPALTVRLTPDDHRYGWFVDRTAFGQDLYTHGRETPLRLARGGTISAQQHLEAAWQAARSALDGRVDADDLWAPDGMVSGTLPLPTEDSGVAREGSIAHRDPPLKLSIEPTKMNLFGSFLKARHRPGFDMAPVMMTWDVTVFLVVNPDRTRRAFACVPRAACRRFLNGLVTGRLDLLIDAYLDAPPSDRRLYRRAQTTTPGLYDELGPRRSLLPLERSPRTSAQRKAWWLPPWKVRTVIRAGAARVPVQAVRP